MKVIYNLTPLALAALLAACGGADAATPPATGVAAPGAAVQTPGATAGTGVATLPGTAAGGSRALTPPVNTGVGAAGGGATITPPAAGAANVPCDVADLVSNNCTTCHSTVVKYGAPMPLMTAADFQAPAKTDPTRKVYQVIPERLNAVDITRRMPPASGSAIPAPGLKVMNDWLAAGALTAATGCAIHEPTAAAPTTGAGGSAAPPTTGGEPNVRSGGASDKPQEYNDPAMQCFEFRAHAQGDMKAPFSVSTQPDMYTNFTFKAPWTGMMYARSFKPLAGNATVIHHWLLYKNAAGGVTDGGISGSTGAHPDGELVHGWAPGGSDLYFDPDVGFEMPGDAGFTLETHHNNTTGAPAPDNSGVQVCVTPKVPKNVASLSWLGTDSISGAMASGVCAPTGQEPIHVIGVSPHMHLKGRHMSVILTRKDGKTETIHDQPFDFNYQHSYLADLMVMPGDSIKTTCTYSGPTSFGEGTNDEMCYAFTLYYPKLSLTNGNPIATLIHGPNTCLQ